MTSKFVDDEAELSDNDEEGEGESLASDTEEPAAKRVKKQSKKGARHQISSDDDEDGPDDEAQIRAEMKGFVVEEDEDEEEEEENDGDEGRTREKGRDAVSWRYPINSRLSINDLSFREVMHPTRKALAS